MKALACSHCPATLPVCGRGHDSVGLLVPSATHRHTVAGTLSGLVPRKPLVAVPCVVIPALSRCCLVEHSNKGEGLFVSLYILLLGIPRNYWVRLLPCWGRHWERPIHP